MKIRQNNKKKWHRRNSGFSLIEVLVALVVLIVLFGALASLYTQYNRYRVVASSRIKLQHVAADVIRQMKIDIQTAALSTESASGTISQRFLVKDLKNNAQPGVFITSKASESQTLTAIHTASIGLGEIVRISGNTLVVSRVDKDQISSLDRGALLFCVRGAGSPAMLELQGKPRKATLSDLSGLMALYNPNRTYVFNITVPASCFGLSGLSTSPTVGDAVVMIDRFISYTDINQELFRQETVGCTRQPQLVSQNFTPGTQCRIQYRYLTTSGPTSLLPGDPSTLQGIQVELTFTDPTTSLTENVQFEALVQPWRKP